MTWISRKFASLAFVGIGALVLASGCEEGGGDEVEEGGGSSDCGPTQATVTRVIDGDTIEVEDQAGDSYRVRYLMIDAPESTSEQECWGEEAKAANEALVDGEAVTLRYDDECEDKFGRLLAYVELRGQEINRVMIERGHACVLFIPPNGDDLVDDYEALEAEARMLGKGLWAACEPIPCG